MSNFQSWQFDKKLKELSKVLGREEKGKKNLFEKKRGYNSAYYLKNKKKYLKAQRKYRDRLKAKRPVKKRSLFLIEKERKIIACLNKRHITVPIPRWIKSKHPIIENWNSAYWWSKDNVVELLKKGWNYFTVLNKDNSYKGARIGCIDIDEKGWTKIPRKYWTSYITAGNGKIKLLFLYRDNQGMKTGKGYFQGKPILDFKISGGIMGIGSLHPNGKPYQLKGAGSFFLLNNTIFNNPYEVAELLKKDWDIEIVSLKEHFARQKATTEIDYNQLETLQIPLRGPPNRASLNKSFRNS